MKLLVLLALAALSMAVNAGKPKQVEYRCIPNAQNERIAQKIGLAHKKRCATLKNKKGCNLYKFKTPGVTCKWTKGHVVSNTKYYNVNRLPKFKNDAEPEAVVTSTTTKKETTWKEFLEYKQTEEFEYYGALAQADDDTGSLAKKTDPCANQQVRDCNGECAPAFWIGNGLCDNGSNKPGKTEPDCQALLNGFCQKRCSSKAKRLAKEPWWVKECNNNCRASEKNKRNVMRGKKCVWYMPKLADYGMDGHGIYNFDCPAFWYDGGDCESKDAAAVRAYGQRASAFNTAGSSVAYAINSVRQHAGNNFVVAGAGAMVVAVAAVALIVKRSRQ